MQLITTLLVRSCWMIIFSLPVLVITSWVNLKLIFALIQITEACGCASALLPLSVRPSLDFPPCSPWLLLSQRSPRAPLDCSFLKGAQELPLGSELSSSHKGARPMNPDRTGSGKYVIIFESKRGSVPLRSWSTASSIKELNSKISDFIKNEPSERSFESNSLA